MKAEISGNLDYFRIFIIFGNDKNLWVTEFVKYETF